ncbi:DUF5997 family protein [Tsukamurella soli]|uniref:DUF5997 family protein n=1 Tax=Tsukamurella soli TaxID=644556 RepID=A0ABP8KE87_9ACTN
MNAQKPSQTMNPATAAKKLDVYLPATPEDFRTGVVSRAEIAALQSDPPQWLRDLRAHGPHPKNLVAAKLGVSISGLARGGVGDALTTEQIDALLSEMPDWLEAERSAYRAVLRDERRVKSLHAERRRSAEQE